MGSVQVSDGVPPPDGPALSHPPTRKGLRWLLWAAALQAVGGFVCFGIFALTVWAFDVRGSFAGEKVQVVFLAISSCTVALSLITVVNNVRMRHVLRHHQWRARPGRSREITSDRVSGLNGVPVVVFTDSDHPDATRSAVTVVTRWWRLEGPESFWYAGLDDRAGVVSPPDGASPIWLRKMRIRENRRKYRQAVIDSAE
jgi:hypothetical protein